MRRRMRNGGICRGGSRAGRLTAALVLAGCLVAGPSVQQVAEGQDGGTGALGLFDPAGAGQRVLVIAPHPDDESLAAGGLIQQALARGAAVRVVVVTAGDGSAGAARRFFNTTEPVPEQYRALGRARAGETLAAAAELGLAPGDVTFLCYPDGGIESLWYDRWDYDRSHRGRNGSDRVPYTFAYRPLAGNCGAGLSASLRGIIREFKPTAVIYPDGHDDHRDHRAVAAFTQYALASEGHRSRELTYLVHRVGYPRPGAWAPPGRLLPPEPLLGLDTRWWYDPLPVSCVRRKAAAIGCYTAVGEPVAPFLRAFARRNEVFGTAEVSRVAVTAVDEGGLRAGAFPRVAGEDPAGDSVAGGPAADLLAVGLVVGESRSYVGISTVAPVGRDVTYAFRMRIFGERGVARLDIHVTGDRVTTLLPAGNSAAPGEMRLLKAPRALWLRIPSTLFEGWSAVMLTAESRVGTRRADTMPWRRLEL